MTRKLDDFRRQVKSRLYPLSLLERVLEWFVERLPRLFMQVELKPNDDVTIMNESKGEYKATSYTPCFEMHLTPNIAQQGGWYYLEAALVQNNGSREAFIRVDLQGENEESVIIHIPTNLRGTVREVFYLPPKVKALNWSPTAAPGFFYQSPLLLHSITSLESTLRRIHRVLFDLFRFQGRIPSTCGRLTFWKIFGNLHHVYQCTANLRINRLRGNDYASFIALHDTFKEADVRAICEQIPKLRFFPFLSLIMSVQDPVTQHFRAALDAISEQFYPYWELLLMGDFSRNSQAQAIAKGYQERHSQIKIICVRADANVTEVINSALELAHGEFIAKIGQYDLLPPHALLYLAQEINRYPETDFIYTDDDDIDETNQRCAPRFKPDWNPDMFYSYNYINNLTIYRRDRVLDLGGYRPGFAGAEDYDLSLRFLKDIPASKIRHIPRVLYHRRILSSPSSSPPAPLSQSDSNERFAHQSGKLALETYFAGRGIIVEDGPAERLYRIKHPLPAQLPLVTIIIPTRDRIDLVRKCIESIQKKTDYKKWEILLVDNQSTEMETFSFFEQIQDNSRIRLIRYEKPFNYSALNNYAVPYAQGEIIALLNNDIEVISEGWLSEMVSHAIRPGIGAAGAKLLYANDLVQHAGVILGLGGVAGHANRYLNGKDHGYCYRAVVTHNLSAVTAACLVVRKKCYQEVGGMNENLAIAFNDVDFCLKLCVAGYRNVFTPYSLLYHHESMSRGHDDTPEKHALFLREFSYMKNTWGKMLLNDPAYNKNLTKELENFSFNQSKALGERL